MSIDRNGLSGDRVKFAQWSRDVEFESRSTLLLELSELGEGTGAGGRDNFVPARQQGKRQLFSKSGPK